MASPNCSQKSKASDQIADKMNQTLSFGIVQLLRIIMSPMSKQQQQREALSSLRSNPGLLLALLKIGLDKTPSESLARTLLTKSGHIGSSNIASSVDNFHNNASAKAAQHSNTPARLSNSQLQRDNSESLPYENNFAVTNNNVNKISKRKRKSQDDLSTDTGNDRCPLEAKYRNDYQIDSPAIDSELNAYSPGVPSPSCSSTSSADDQSEKLVVRKMIEILMNPLTVHHQQTVLAVLRSDEKLRNLFFKEKEHMSNMKIPVFRNSTTEKSPDQGIFHPCESSMPIVENVVSENQFSSVPSYSSLNTDSQNSFLHISESDLTYTCENLQESNIEPYELQTSEEAAVFDSALHEHFIDLSQELYLINNVSYDRGQMIGESHMVEESQMMSSSMISTQLNCMTSQQTG
ncbi:hypothetical protein FSP39_000020 [Pinctada imbricata]|uniref:Uncharacterized protein n=1 Tax=Pinctada imbricata TaxID=66713 RepID=A0AA88YC24_PINIB|nr:hypothetical protein FSP39_000020 [Pinctada imbricata]